MDAETGFALGGNKVRKLEYELAPDRMRGVTCLVTAGGPQSNHRKVTAAAAARLGLRCVLVTQGPPPQRPTGNALLHRLFGAEVVTVATTDELGAKMHEITEEVNAKGGHAMLVPLGSLGYARAALELMAQLDALEDTAASTTIFVSASPCVTLAGLLRRLALLERTDVRLIGVSAEASAEVLCSTTLTLAGGGASLLRCEPDLNSVTLITVDDQVSGGYGVRHPHRSRQRTASGHSKASYSTLRTRPGLRPASLIGSETAESNRRSASSFCTPADIRLFSRRWHLLEPVRQAPTVEAGVRDR